MKRRTPDQMALKIADDLWQRLYDMDKMHPALGGVEAVISILAAIVEGVDHPALADTHYEHRTEG